MCEEVFSRENKRQETYQIPNSLSRFFVALVCCLKQTVRFNKEEVRQHKLLQVRKGIKDLKVAAEPLPLP